ncbi:MAG TPA: hypothetical protein VNI01_08255 [Elusimicrobiota bacterium]|jgi:hypothetical protein|nr:hypothetical protein [Elusimicrobiota bacterium]
MSKKKEKEEEETAAANGASVEQLVLDKKAGKYPVVPLIAVWAKELRKAEEHRHLTQNEILELAMSEVLNGKVTEKELIKRQAVQVAEALAAAESPLEKARKKV